MQSPSFTKAASPKRLVEAVSCCSARTLCKLALELLPRPLQEGKGDLAPILLVCYHQVGCRPQHIHIQQHARIKGGLALPLGRLRLIGRGQAKRRPQRAGAVDFNRRGPPLCQATAGQKQW